MVRPSAQSGNAIDLPTGGWGVPLFVVGACGLAAVIAALCWARPESPAAAPTYDRVLQAWEQEDWDAVTRWAQAWLESPDAASLERGEVQFMAASAWLHRAEITREPGALPQARHWLDQAAATGVRSQFTAAMKAHEIWLRYLEGAPAEPTLRDLESLARSPTGNRNFVLLRLLHLYRAATPPEWTKAKTVVESLLAQPKVRNVDELRLTLAEVLVALGKAAEALTVLDRVQSTHAAVNQSAGRLRARCLVHEGRRGEAVAVWRAHGPAATWPHDDRLLFAETLALEGDTAAALREYSALGQESTPTPAVLEARLRAGELRAAAGQYAEAQFWLVQAWRLAATPDTPLAAQKSEIWAQIERAVDRWHDAGNPAAAAALALAVEEVTPTVDAAHLVARIHRRHGEAILATLPLRLGRDRAVPEAARQALTAAADAYLRGRDRAETTAMHHAAQVQAATCLVEARAYIRALGLLDAVVPELPAGPRRTEALVILGEAAQALGQSRAEVILREAVAHPGPWEPRASYLLALALVDQRQWAEAEERLRRLVTLGIGGTEPPEARLARFTLGYVLLWQGKFTLAAQAFETACRLHPGDPSALEARYWIAAAWVHAARAGEQEQPRTPAGRTIVDAQRRQRLEQALAAFQTLSQEFADRHAKSSLDDAQARTWRTIRREMGEVLYLLQRYDEALQIFDFILFDGPSAIEAALTLRQMILCRLAKSDKTEARKLLLRLSQQLDQVPDGELGGNNLSRVEWLQWIEWANQESR